MAWVERLQVQVGQVELQAEWLQALMGQVGGFQM
jgi:hypothetical protein